VKTLRQIQADGRQQVIIFLIVVFWRIVALRGGSEHWLSNTIEGDKVPVAIGLDKRIFISQHDLLP
jgi:hypothetical protein